MYDCTNVLKESKIYGRTNVLKEKIYIMLTFRRKCKYTVT